MANGRSGPARLEQDVVIERMRSIHADRYDYSKFVYVTLRTKGEIVCREHGSFFQTYSNHFFKRSGCPTCVHQRITRQQKEAQRTPPKKLTRESALARATEAHGTKFDYNAFEFVDIKTPGKIGCPAHGSFWMSVLDHVKSKTGCPECSKEVQRERLRFSFVEAVARAKNVHGNVYEYPEQEYRNATTPMTIVCRHHGPFEQSLDSHVHQMSGCPKCFGSAKRTTAQFVEAARAIHGDRFDYSGVEYVNNSTRVKITCQTHGDFWQMPRKHINVGQGCPRCADSVSKTERKWLARVGVPDDDQHRQVQLEGTRCVADGKINRTLYEFYGTYWHGDPRRYNPDDLNVKNGRRMGTLYLETLERQQKLKKLGYELKFVWEIDYRAGKLFSELNPHEV